MAQRRWTHQRELVLEALDALCTHPSAAEVYEYVHTRDERVSLATVYRNLNLLVDEGDIIAVDTASGRRYDHRTDEHGHLVCAQCGSIVDVTMPYEPALDEYVCDRMGYTNVRHHLFFEGICPACAAQVVGNRARAGDKSERR